MGADESKPSKQTTRSSHSRDISEQEVERILRLQRQQYEERIQEVISQANSGLGVQTARPTPPPIPRALQPTVSKTPAQIFAPTTVPSAGRPTTTAPKAPAPILNHSAMSSVRPTSTLRPPTVAPSAPAPVSNTSNFARARTVNNLHQPNIPVNRESIVITNSLYPDLSAPINSMTLNSRSNSAQGRTSAPARDNSVARNQGAGDDDKLNCPTCRQRFGLYIYQCGSGHSSCKDCRMRLARCGVCHQPITNMRNIALEDYVSQVKTPCVNSADGCSLHFKLIDMDSHIKECPFNEIVCPLGRILGGLCNWRGKTSQIENHFKDRHPGQCQINVDTEAYLPNICTEDEHLHLVVIGAFNFLVYLRVSQADRNIYMMVQLLGTAISAAKWNYELHVYNKREPRRKYQHVDVCASASVPFSEMVQEARCAAMPLQHAMTFVNEGVLTYKFFIKKEQDRAASCGRRRGAWRKH